MSTYPDYIADEALAFEKSNWVNGPVSEDKFYTVSNDTNAAPGTSLECEKETPSAGYSLPPSTSLSRIVYQSKSLNGDAVPASAYILWPHLPRKQEDGFSVVVYAHGSSGLGPNCAPSHMKNLWDHFKAPYLLALLGYVVVAPDYAGQGVSKNAAGKSIIHELLASPAQAHDVFYAVEAAQKSFPELSKKFVVLGHSQGGGAAWACAQRQAETKVEGYLGAVAVSPLTNLVDQTTPFGSLLFVATIPSIVAANPGFKPSDVLTADGENRLETMLQAGGCPSSCIRIVMGTDMGTEVLKPNWKNNSTVREHKAVTTNGGRRIKGPLLIIHGDMDPVLSASASAKAAEKTAESFPDSQMEYITLTGITHVPAMFASVRIWMDWIEARFAGHTVNPGLKMSVETGVRSIEGYRVPELDWYLEPATQMYHAP